jgi:acetoin utilization protein AcuA
VEHYKIYQRTEIAVKGFEIEIEGPVNPEKIKAYHMHETLSAFRQPQEQQEALFDIAGLTEGRIIMARQDKWIIGYVTFHYPDELERWSQEGMEDLIELGAIEVASPFRGLGLGKRMLELAFSKGQMDNVIVFTTEYYWHWDLEGAKLNVWEYRKMMERLMQSVGMVWFATDDPEICSHPANCLMVKVGKDVSLDSQQQFDRIRFQRKFMY